MDKKSNRTDLLAAGRKKLQQYRQKKDNKGKDGKGKDGKGGSSSTTNKIVKTEQIDASLVSAADTKKAQSSELPVIEADSSVNSVDCSFTSERTFENSESTSADFQSSVDMPVLHLVSTETLLNQESDFYTPTVGGEVAISAGESGGSWTSGATKLDAVHADVLAPSSNPAPEAASDAESVAVDSVDAKGLLEGDQEADIFDPTHPDRNVEFGFGKDETPPFSYIISKEAITPNSEPELGVYAAAISGSVGDHEIVEASVPVETNLVDAVKEGHATLYGQGEDVMNWSINDNSLLRDSRYSEAEEKQACLDLKAVKEYKETNLPEESSVIDVKCHKDVTSNLGDCAEDQSLCIGVQSNSLDLIQPAVVQQGQSEDDLKYLIKSREMADHGDLAVPKNEMVAIAEFFQQQLYLINISKDLSHLQNLDQHKQQTDHGLVEVRALSALLTDVQECNKRLSGELAQCRSELEVAISEKLNFENICHSATEENVELSAKVDELKTKLDESMTFVSSVSAEMANCKVSLEASEVENEKLVKSLASVSEQRNKYEEAMLQQSHENQKLSQDMVEATNQLTALEQETTNLKISLASLNNESSKLDEEKTFIFHEKEMLSGDLVDCRNMIASLNQENSGLNTSLAVLTEECKKVKDHEEFLAQEFERLSTELLVFKDKVSDQHQENVQLEAELKEVMARLEQIAEENMFLHSSLKSYKARIAESDSRKIQLSSVGNGSKSHIRAPDTVSCMENSTKEDTEVPLLSVATAPTNVSDGTSLGELRSGFSEGGLILKGYIEEAEKYVQMLGKAIDGMYSHSISLSQSNGNSSAGVSKLIQTFEAKANIDDHEREESLLTESLRPRNPYFVAKDQLSCLQDVLQSLAQNGEQVEALMKEENSCCKAIVVTCGDLEVEVEALKGISTNLEARNIELEVICGALNQHAHDVEAKKTQLEDKCEFLTRQHEGVELQKIELSKKLTNTYSRIIEMQVQLKEIKKGSGDLASTILNEVETLQREMREGMLSVEREWNSAFAKLVPMVKKLETVLRSADSYPHLCEVSHELEVIDCLSHSVSAVCKVIESWKPRLEAHDELSSSSREIEEKLSIVSEERCMAIRLLQKISADLVNVLNFTAEHLDDSHIKGDNQQDPLDASFYEALVAKLGSLLGDTLQLKDLNSKLSSDLSNKANDIEELKKRCVDSDTLLKLVLNIKEVLKVNSTEVELDETPVSQLQSFVFLLIQKYKELEEPASSLIKYVNPWAMGFDELQGYVESLNSLIIEQQNDILVLKASLVQAKDGFDAMQVELLQKGKELEQSEQRFASVREKLSIAVSKGKGLIVQRDGLKQSLADMSSELEKCSDELHLKDSRLLEVEEKLKDYSEAGERMEALESELTYIRNSATALRESFYLKDSTLQKIEEILEDLELPDHFHTKDIIEKVDWLAKAVACNSLPPGDWDQRSSVGGGSYSDACFVVTDGIKDDVQPTLNTDEDVKRKYEELQTKFYELAEQNDMLEQSLMERNILVQRWEEILDRINTPTQIRSMEPEERIHWLGTALSEADHHMRSLQKKIENLENYSESLSHDLEESQRKSYELESSMEVILHEKENALSEINGHSMSLQQKINSLENYCGSLSTDLEDSKRRLSELESTLERVIKNKEALSHSLVASTSDCEIALYIAAQNELERDNLRMQVDLLQAKLVKKLENEDQINQIEGDLKRLQSLILDVLQDSRTEDDSSDACNIRVLEGLIRELVNRSRGVDSEVHIIEAGVQEHILENVADALVVSDMENDKGVRDMDVPKSRTGVDKEQNVEDLRRELAEALGELVSLRDERDLYLQKSQSAEIEMEELDKRKKELLVLLNQEEQKSASLREKLNLAVRKGKSVVQQRDSLKQRIEEITGELDQLKLMISGHEQAMVESGQKISDLTVQIEMYKAFETENLSLKSHLIEAEQRLNQKSHALSLFLNKLSDINAGEGFYANDPLPKLEGIAKMCSDLQHTATSWEQEAKKSKKSSELLLTELNEVQERNDGLQEELERAYDQISNLSKERDLANSAKLEALSHLDNLSEERENKLTELERLKSSVHGMKKVFLDLSTLSDEMFVKNLELLRDVRVQMESCLELGVDTLPVKDHAVLVSVNSRFKDFLSRTSASGNKIPGLLDETAGFDVCEAIEQHLQQLTETVSDFKERIQGYSLSLKTEAEWLSTATGSMISEVASQRSFLESIKDDNIRVESIGKEKDMELVELHRTVTVLYDACTTSITELENRKAHLAGESFSAENLRKSLPALPATDGVSFLSYEEPVKALADKILVAVNDFVDIGTKGFEGHSKEFKGAILELQKELQEKDIQRERICMELVSQIKEAEATAANCARDLQSMKNYGNDLENKLEALGRDKDLLERRVNELQQEHLGSTELAEKVKSLTAALAAKEQEIEVLMQALDEEENQMEAMRNKIEELEKAAQQKNLDLEHVEASRVKVIKKLSVTVSKFDELHRMSEGLLSEIENLQTQLQDRDSEISFLRQEVTRCTNDALEATKKAKEHNSGELPEFLTWLDAMLSGALKREAQGVDGNFSPHPGCKEHVQIDITSIISELEDLRIAAQSKETLLQAERNKMEELSQRKNILETLLHEKEQRVNSIQGVGVSGIGTSEIVELEPVLNKWTSPIPSSQIRSLRKVNNDQVAIAIDTNATSSGRIEDEDDDKVHGFKSLTMSRFVPKFTRPVSDMVDGLWVSCDRALMRQPALRLGIMIYWAVLHAFLASIIV